MFQPILGIDISKLDLSLTLLIDNNYYHSKVENNQQGFNDLIIWFNKYKITKVTACMEAHSTLQFC